MSLTPASPFPNNSAAAADQANRVHVATGPGRPANKPTQAESIKDTLISIVIAFALAFVFRGFVVEAFVIPTGSMAPTLMGAHMRFTSPSTGYSWPVGPWEQVGQNEYAGVQGAGNNDSISVHDPISGDLLDRRNVPLQSGDRILVLKYLYSINDPHRFDVIVFKNPTEPSVNYIKRLIGLPGEEIALVDGDVFTRKAGAASDSGKPSANSWTEQGWKIARKEPLQQMAVWQTIFDSSYTPLESSSFSSPWNSADAGPGGSGPWKLDGPSYTLNGAAIKNANGRTELFFDQSRQRFPRMSYHGMDRGEKWTIDDRYAYDEVPQGRPLAPQSFQMMPRFPVSDVRMRAGIELTDSSPVVVEATLRARGHDFQARIEGSTATLRMRDLGGGAVGAPIGEWKAVATQSIAPLREHKVTNVEFWHADQSMQLWIDDRKVVEYDYEWSPAERILNATGQTIDQIMSDPKGQIINPLANPALYRGRTPDVRWAFSGLGSATLKLHRVGLDRDLFYQPAMKLSVRPEVAGLATAPSSPLKLNKDQFFACGDNSPQSLDGRLWDSVDSWVAYEFDNTVGVVPRELLLGRAFFVYWPSLIKTGRGVPVPDFGRMRFIW